MQYTKDKLKAQQMVMFHLGFYKGVIDGIWSDSSIAAKKAFEAHPSFVPSNPNGGLPFGERDRLPRGMVYREGLVCHVDLTEERIAEIEKGMQARVAATRGNTEVVQPVDETPHAPENEGIGEEGEPGPDSVEGKANPLAGDANPNESQKTQHKHQHNQHKKRR